MGVPHRRWRDSTQSGRFAIIAWMRFSPHGGTHSVAAMASSERSRRPA
jgi:hypothetical protein